MFDSRDAAPPAGDPATPIAVPDLTGRQRQVLEVVRAWLSSHGYPPTVREIGEELGLASSSTVHSHLSALERAGIIERDPSKPRAIGWGPAARLVGVDPDATSDDGPAPMRASGNAGAGGSAHGDVQVDEAVAIPLVGSVAAGAPLLAEEHVESYLNVPTALVRGGESFLLKVRGDSMIDAGILDGDWVVVRHQPDARDGEIVVALVGEDAEATCKRLRRVDGRVELVPENSSMEPMVPDIVDVVGVVTGVMRAI